jgi:hypothetical protein
VDLSILEVLNSLSGSLLNALAADVAKINNERISVFINQL